MRRRLFQCFQQSIKSGRRQHMYFIDDVDFIPTQIGREIDLVTQVANIINAGIGCRIDLDQVQKTPFIDGLTNRALIARPLLPDLHPGS